MTNDSNTPSAITDLAMHRSHREFVVLPIPPSPPLPPCVVSLHLTVSLLLFSQAAARIPDAREYPDRLEREWDQVVGARGPRGQGLRRKWTVDQETAYVIVHLLALQPLEFAFIAMHNILKELLPSPFDCLL